ncbi:MAG: hypothetical protein KC455_01905 [Carnobacterium sp.]|nr:hypothetical protein [Carnobacterium sp.]
MKKIVKFNDTMQKGQYELTEEPGKNFDSEFKPELSPKELLELGVFGGKYMTDCKDEFPENWFEHAKLSPEKADISLNYYQVDASMPLKAWQEKGWIHSEDPRGWFQWYCRYYYGRRLPEEDQIQIKRWKAIKRHAGAIKKNCENKDQSCRKKQRQTLLHWAYDSRTI